MAATARDYTPMHDALRAIGVERFRQEDLKAAGRFKFTCADRGMTEFEKLAVLTEEVGEVARALLTLPRHQLARDGHASSIAQLRDELVQVAAVAVAWIEALS